MHPRRATAGGWPAIHTGGGRLPSTTAAVAGCAICPLAVPTTFSVAFGSDGAFACPRMRSIGADKAAIAGLSKTIALALMVGQSLLNVALFVLLFARNALLVSVFRLPFMLRFLRSRQMYSGKAESSVTSVILRFPTPDFILKFLLSLEFFSEA